MPVRRVGVAVSFGLAILVGIDAHPRAQEDPAGAFAALGWQLGPTDGDLGGIASISVPEGYQFVGQGGAGRFLELLENPSSGDELGVPSLAAKRTTSVPGHGSPDSTRSRIPATAGGAQRPLVSR